MAVDTKSRELTELRPDSDKTEELISKLREGQLPVAQAFGTGDVLFRLIEKATEDAYIRHPPHSGTSHGDGGL